LEVARKHLKKQLRGQKREIERVEKCLATYAGRLAEREHKLERASEELPSGQKELDCTNGQLKSLNEQLAAATKDLQSAWSRLAAAKRELSAAREQLRHTETQLVEVGKERDKANASNAQLAELTRPNGLVDNVKRLKSELENTQIQLANEEQRLDSILRRRAELDEQLKATQACLDKKTADLNKVRNENERLWAQLEDAEREVEQYSETLDGLLKALQGEVAGETDEVVLGGLKRLREVASSIPGDIAANLHVRCLNRTIRNVAEIKNLVALLEDTIFNAPKRRREEFEANLKQIGKDMAVGARDGEKYDLALKRFCKIGAGKDVDYGDRDLSGDEFLAAANSVAKKSFEILLHNDDDITKLQKLVGDRIDVNASMSQYLPGLRRNLPLISIWRRGIPSTNASISSVSW
jgi:DNA repair exonuclease SbcCD ATPase subunit